MAETRKLDKESMRRRGRELRAILNEWDPIGVMGEDASPGDTEYDDLLWPLMRLLEQGASETELAEWLQRKLDADYGLNPEFSEFSGVARRAKVWFEQNWSDTRA